MHEDLSQVARFEEAQPAGFEGAQAAGFKGAQAVEFLNPYLQHLDPFIFSPLTQPKSGSFHFLSFYPTLDLGSFAGSHLLSFMLHADETDDDEQEEDKVVND
ncbi:hypothetical protein SLEP1_g12729 [Rubroshorea leprosula]|uniref:Uncharacterized protein n=1 Tax=Rubroshorea leprosula TaxID=152421 RepID=A0AAV5IMW8_9ROSI|nr:hypothetical protein SLEP1_g12729 [Rubroshorea leprosula]